MTTTPVIAIVDDDEAVLEAMGHLVRSFDFSVHLFGSGQALLDGESLRQFDCVITDVEMPHMNGFAMCEQIRTRGFQLPIIFMTAFVKEGYDTLARESGAACFLNKPFEDTEILHCLEGVLGLRGKT